MKKLILFSCTILFLTLTSGCVQETHLKTITFKVNMENEEAASKVGIRGEFTDIPWQETLFMKDEDEDGIYEVVIKQKTANSQVAFKFVNKGDQFELEGKENRVLNFKYAAETIIYRAIFNEPDSTEIDRN